MIFCWHRAFRDRHGMDDLAVLCVLWCIGLGEFEAGFQRLSELGRCAFMWTSALLLLRIYDLRQSLRPFMLTYAMRSVESTLNRRGFNVTALSER